MLTHSCQFTAHCSDWRSCSAFKTQKTKIDFCILSTAERVCFFFPPPSTPRFLSSSLHQWHWLQCYVEASTESCGPGGVNMSGCCRCWADGELVRDPSCSYKIPSTPRYETVITEIIRGAKHPQSDMTERADWDWRLVCQTDDFLCLSVSDFVSVNCIGIVSQSLEWICVLLLWVCCMCETGQFYLFMELPCFSNVSSF